MKKWLIAMGIIVALGNSQTLHAYRIVWPNGTETEVNGFTYKTGTLYVTGLGPAWAGYSGFFDVVVGAAKPRRADKFVYNNGKLTVYYDGVFRGRFD